MKEFIAHNFVPVTGCIMMFTFVLLNKGLSKRKRHFFILPPVMSILQSGEPFIPHSDMLSGRL